MNVDIASVIAASRSDYSKQVTGQKTRIVSTERIPHIGSPKWSMIALAGQ